MTTPAPGEPQAPALQGTDPSGPAPGEPALWSSRALAAGLDFIVMLVAIAPLLALGAISLHTQGFDAVTVIVFVLVTAVYTTLLMRRLGPVNGATWGKQWAGIRVVRDDGLPVDTKFALLRESAVKGIAYFVIALIPVVGALALMVFYLWPLWDRENRAVHDFIVHSHVVQA